MEQLDSNIAYEEEPKREELDCSHDAAIKKENGWGCFLCKQTIIEEEYIRVRNIIKSRGGEYGIPHWGNKERISGEPYGPVGILFNPLIIKH